MFEHAYQHAHEGFAIDLLLWGWIWEYRHKMARFPEGQKLWYPNGHLLGPGDRLVQRNLARTIHNIQHDETLEWFYRGAFARRYVAAVQADGGRLTLDDMAAHHGVVVSQEATIVGRCRGYEIHSPTSHLIALALRAIEHGDLRHTGRPTENPESLYRQMRLIEEVFHYGLDTTSSSFAEIMSSHENVGLDAKLIATDQVQQTWQRVISEPSGPHDDLGPV